MIDLDSKSLELVRHILEKYLPNTEVKAFGSRVTGKAKQFSDLDLVVIDIHPIPIEKINELKLAFSNSNLPILIDIVEWHALSDEFREKINSEMQDL